MTDTPLSELNEHVDSPSATEEAGHGAKEGDFFSLLDLLIVLAERKRIIFGVTAAFAILMTVYSLTLPNVYTATVTLLPPQQNSSSAGLSSQLGGLASLTGFGLKGPNDMYISMLRSRVVEDAMVQRFGLMKEYHTGLLSDASAALQNHAIMDGYNRDGLIRISIVDRDPRRAAELANGYVDQFRILSQHLAITEASQRRLFFEQELEQAKENLANAEEALKQTEQTTGVTQLEDQAHALSGAAASLRTQIIAREVEIQGMQTYATGENAQLVQAQRELETLRAQLAKVGGSEDSPGSDLIIPKGRVPEAGLEYLRKLRDVKYYETIFDILARQYEAAKLDEAKQGALIQVLDPAVPPDRRSYPRRRFMVFVATIIGFVVGLFMALFHAGYQRLRRYPGATVKLRLLVRTIFLVR
jgi:tyrosine-protein kinase Etk/Wzc